MQLTAAHIEEVRNEYARRKFSAFTSRTFQYSTGKPFIWNWHHVYCADELQAFVDNQDRKHLAIFLPTQVGKSEMATRRLPAYILGRYPDKRVGIISYSHDRAAQFNRDVQRIMLSPEYKKIFPETRLNERNVVSDSEGAYLRNSTQFEIVGHTGFLISTGIGGMLNGISLDYIIMDDTVKNRNEALSPVMQQTNRSWWDGVGKTRLDNAGKILIVNTRWAEGDLSGSIVDAKEFDFKVIVIPALKVNNNDPRDPRQIGESIWEEKHSRERYEAQKKANGVVFEAVQQQNPGTPSEVLVYPGHWEEIDELPDYSRFWGLDFGHSSSPDCLLEMCYDNKRLYIDEKFYLTGLSTGKLAEKIKAAGAARGPIYCDAASPRTIEDLQENGINAYPAIKGQGSVRAGIKDILALKIYLTRASKNMWLEKKRYQYPTGADNLPMPGADPIKADDHAMDAMRYGIYTYLKEGGINVYEGSEDFY